MADPIPAEFAAKMNALAAALDEVFNGAPGQEPRIGFVLLTAEFDQIEGGRVNYISNGDRATMHAMLREFLARAEGRFHEARGQQ